MEYAKAGSARNPNGLAQIILFLVTEKQIIKLYRDRGMDPK